ncbi:uncharacterized protein MCYG_06690 [Microsporum canis CBS 113480]|uniref:Uncharacterized protein n=1 Tax=Arthroderma otae (strain ATCC MYA-4605 / CBS 113480) TaxID=554155 RepID=C5FVD7_ARTOC|nr:uncharacterized protein MCYG_06690 [Microsporum canis CBS 113480]EEQ33871.1 predicted protein [Microsporum canis CBS 113480]
MKIVCTEFSGMNTNMMGSSPATEGGPSTHESGFKGAMNSTSTRSTNTEEHIFIHNELWVRSLVFAAASPLQSHRIHAANESEAVDGLQGLPPIRELNPGGSTLSLLAHHH